MIYIHNTYNISYNYLCMYVYICIYNIYAYSHRCIRSLQNCRREKSKYFLEKNAVFFFI